MSAKTSQELKGLQVREQQLIGEIDAKEAAAKEINQDLSALKGRLNTVRQQIKTLQEQSAEPVISEHALLRYLERVKGVNIDAIRAEILDGRAGAIKAMKNGQINSGGMTIIVKNCTIVSITA